MPGPGEDRLGEDGAREQQPDLEADDRRDRQQRVPEDVPRVDGARRDALRARRADVVLVLDVEHGGARDPGDDRERDRAERDRGQDQVLDRVPERLPVAGDDRVEDVEVRRVLERRSGRGSAPTVGSQPSLHREDVLEDDREEEDRDRDPDQRDEQARVVDRAPVALRRDEAERDPEDVAKIIAADRQLDRRREALA